jgi:hypothetical protein
MQNVVVQVHRWPTVRRAAFFLSSQDFERCFVVRAASWARSVRAGFSFRGVKSWFAELTIPKVYSS